MTCNPSLLKYEQIVAELQEAVRQKKLKLGDPVPSISRVSREYGCARETVVKAFNVLKREGVVESCPGKGFYVASEAVQFRPRVFLLLNNLTPYMEVLYNAFVEQLADRAAVDVFFHHNQFGLFEQLLRDHSRRYFSYIVKPFAHPRIDEILGRLDPRELLVLDRREGANAQRSYICQEFDEDFRACLAEALPRIQAYTRLFLIYSEKQLHPKSCRKTFTDFAADHGLQAKVLSNAPPLSLKRGDAFIVLTDADLVQVLRACKQRGLKVGADVGIISYNDNPIKEFVASGITTISADFARMGRQAADFAMTQTPVQKFEHAALISRQSL